MPPSLTGAFIGTPGWILAGNCVGIMGFRVLGLGFCVLGVRFRDCPGYEKGNCRMGSAPGRRSCRGHLGVGRNHVPVSARCQVGSGLRVQGFRVLGSVQGDREHSVQGLELGVEP